jgi:dihydrofolate reductase
MILSIITAVSENHVIGKNNDLVWYLPADLKYFKNKTLGHSLIMGRKTFESFGKPLPKRTSIVITRQTDYQIPSDNCFVVHSLQQAIERVSSEDEAFIAGGSEIYRQALPLAQKLYLTRIHANFDGDTFFPLQKPEQHGWKLIAKQYHKPDEKNKYPFSFLEYVKK